MNGWIPVIKAVMPHLAQIVTAAAPAFTARPGMVAQQINELQTAARNNADATKVLAEQAQQMTRVLEELNAATEQARVQLRLIRRLAVAALVVGVLALVLVIVLMATR